MAEIDQQTDRFASRLQVTDELDLVLFRQGIDGLMRDWFTTIGLHEG